MSHPGPGSPSTTSPIRNGRYPRWSASAAEEGGIAIIDLIAPDPSVAERHNELERLRDPSHTSALSPERMTDLIAASGAVVEHEVSTDQKLDLERWLAQSGTPRETAEEIRAALEAELEGGPPTGMWPVPEDGLTGFTQRWSIFVARVTSP